MIPVHIRTFPDHASIAPAIPPGATLVALTRDDQVVAIVSGSGPGEPLPPLVTLELEDDRIEESILLDLADLLGLLTEVPGVLVERAGRPYGVVARADVAAALPLELLDEGPERLGNVPGLPSRRYICRKCEPPSRRLPRSTTTGLPACSRVWSHGPMELEGG